MNPYHGVVTVLGNGDGGDGGVVMGGEGENSTAGHGGITMVASLVTPFHHLSHLPQHQHCLKFVKRQNLEHMIVNNWTNSVSPVLVQCPPAFDTSRWHSSS